MDIKITRKSYELTREEWIWQVTSLLAEKHGITLKSVPTGYRDAGTKVRLENDDLALEMAWRFYDPREQKYFPVDPGNAANEIAEKIAAN